MRTTKQSTPSWRRPIRSTVLNGIPQRQHAALLLRLVIDIQSFWSTASLWIVGLFRCSSSVPRCRRIHHERRHERLRGVDQWQMAPARQSHEGPRRYSHLLWQIQVYHFTFRAAEGPRCQGTCEPCPFDLRTSWLMSLWRRLCTCEANRGVVDSARTASSAKCNSGRPQIAMSS